MTQPNYDELKGIAERACQSMMDVEKQMLDHTGEVLKFRAKAMLSGYNNVSQETVEDLCCLIENRVMSDG